MNSKVFEDRIFSFPKKTITRQELFEKILCNNSETDLFNLIGSLRDKLIPIKSSGTNGNKTYPIYEKYKIIRQENDNLKLLEEINSLHPLLNKSGYLKRKPEEYLKNKTNLKKLDKWLFENNNVAIEEISCKERSFQIFNDEKWLDNNKNLIRKLNLEKKNLSFYDTPKNDFIDYIPKKKSEITLLICENKDIWFNLRKLMFNEHINKFFGKNIDGVLYGSGNEITKPTALEEYSKFLDINKICFLYWGDIDKPGFDIYLRLKRVNPKLEIDLFKEGYSKMIELAERIDLPDSEDEKIHKEDYTVIYNLFDEKISTNMKKYIDLNKRLPQEIISFSVLKNNAD